jgi:hypothetical protein
MQPVYHAPHPLRHPEPGGSATTPVGERTLFDFARELGPGKTVATVAVDSGLKYLAGDLYTT